MPYAEPKRTIFHTWRGMLKRFYDPNHRAFENYGGRGITVCDRWRASFPAFLADMGERPSPRHSIDRINNDGNYEPENCRWATQNEQRLNQRPRKPDGMWDAYFSQRAALEGK